MKTVFVLCFFAFSAEAAYEGDYCTKDGVVGTCTNIRNCPAALEDIQHKRPPQHCGFGGMDPIVCCLPSASPSAPTTTTPRPALTTTKRNPVSTTTEYIPPVYDYKDVDPVVLGDKVAATPPPDGCDPIPLSLTSRRTGQKAWDKCIEYQEKLVFPCGKCTSILGGKCRTNRCHHNAGGLILGGVAAEPFEFPHMALLGYGSDPANLEWLCGGSLISEKFILTAGHCISRRDVGEVSYVQLGALRRSQITAQNRYRVRKVHRHPRYDPPNKYHDIALLELENEVPLNDYLVPACIHTGATVNDTLASATGWGLTDYNGRNSDNLQKVILTKFDPFECAITYPPNRLMLEGVDQSSQICYGDRTKSRDTCQGDSGGPLQIKSQQIACMYTIMGVTSFGSACGFIGVPGIYTRVQNYLSWIETTVWP